MSTSIVVQALVVSQFEKPLRSRSYMATYGGSPPERLQDSDRLPNRMVDGLLCLPRGSPGNGMAAARV